MAAFYLVMVPLSVLGGVWLTFRLRPVDPRGRFLTLIVGVAISGLALYRGLQGQSPLTNQQSMGPQSRPQALPALGAGVVPDAITFFLIVMVASFGVFIFYVAYFALKEGNLRVLRTRGPTILGYVLCIGAYFYISIFPMGLVKRHLLHFANQTPYEIAIAYVSLIAILIFVAIVLAFDEEVRRHKAFVTAFFFGCVVVAASSPFVWAVIATAVPAAQPLGVLSVFAMVAPAPTYFLLHYRLGWL